MSTLEYRAVRALKEICCKCNIELSQFAVDISKLCNPIINEYEARQRRLGEKENLSKDQK